MVSYFDEQVPETLDIPMEQLDDLIRKEELKLYGKMLNHDAKADLKIASGDVFFKVGK